MKHLLLTIALASSFAAPGFAGEAAHGNKSGDTHGEMKIGMPGDAAAIFKRTRFSSTELTGRDRFLCSYFNWFNLFWDICLP